MPKIGQLENKTTTEARRHGESQGLRAGNTHLARKGISHLGWGKNGLNPGTKATAHFSKPFELRLSKVGKDTLTSGKELFVRLRNAQLSGEILVSIM